MPRHQETNPPNKPQADHPDRVVWMIASLDQLTSLNCADFTATVIEE